MKLRKNIINLFEKNGVVILRNIINKNWLNQLERGIKKNFINPSEYKCVYEKNNTKELFYDDYCNWQRIEEYKDFLFNSNISNIASQLIRSKKINIFHEHVLIKEPGSKKKTPWHQDQSYYCIEGQKNISFWIPLNKIYKSVCPEFVKGSHKWSQKFLPTKFFGENYAHSDKQFKKIPDIDKERSKYDILSASLNPGDAIAFSFATVHGAPGNSSKKRRVAFSARFIGDDARYIKRKGEMSPPFPNIKFKNGDILDSKTFPIVSI